MRRYSRVRVSRGSRDSERNSTHSIAASSLDRTPTVPDPAEPILLRPGARVVEILPARVSQRFDGVEARARPERNDGTLCIGECADQRGTSATIDTGGPKDIDGRLSN